MSDIGGLVETLIAAGTPPAVAAQVVAMAFAAGVSSADFRVTDRDVTAEKRREADRIRQQRRRDNLRISADCHVTSADVTNASLSKEVKIEEIKEERGATPSRRHAASRGSRLPDDWAPSVPDTAIADETLGSPERRRAELEKFRDHWKQQPGSKGVKLDWDAAWRNWIRRAAEYRGGTNGNGNRGAQQRRSASSDFFAGIASVAADIAGDSQAPRPANEEIPVGRVNIDL